MVEGGHYGRRGPVSDVDKTDGPHALEGGHRITLTPLGRLIVSAHVALNPWACPNFAIGPTLPIACLTELDLVTESHFGRIHFSRPHP